jgi:hypothetical protein
MITEELYNEIATQLKEAISKIFEQEDAPEND